MVIPCVFDSILGIKPKSPSIASLLSQEVGSQDIGINHTQFHSCIDERVNAEIEVKGLGTLFPISSMCF